MTFSVVGLNSVIVGLSKKKAKCKKQHTYMEGESDWINYERRGDVMWKNYENRRREEERKKEEEEEEKEERRRINEWEKEEEIRREREWKKEKEEEKKRKEKEELIRFKNNSFYSQYDYFPNVKNIHMIEMNGNGNRNGNRNGNGNGNE
jgi:hypothetical protein